MVEKKSDAQIYDDFQILIEELYNSSEWKKKRWYKPGY